MVVQKALTNEEQLEDVLKHIRHMSELGDRVMSVSLLSWKTITNPDYVKENLIQRGYEIEIPVWDKGTNQCFNIRW